MRDEGIICVLNVNIGLESFLTGVNGCVCLCHYW